MYIYLMRNLRSLMRFFKAKPKPVEIPESDKLVRFMGVNLGTKSDLRSFDTWVSLSVLLIVPVGVTGQYVQQNLDDYKSQYETVLADAQTLYEEHRGTIDQLIQDGEDQFDAFKTEAEKQLDTMSTESDKYVKEFHQTYDTVIDYAQDLCKMAGCCEEPVVSADDKEC